MPGTLAKWQEAQRRSQGPPRDITEPPLDSKALLNLKENSRALYALRRPFTHVDFVAKRHDSWRFQHPFFAPQKSISIFWPNPRGFSSWDTTTLPFVASRGVRIHPLFRAENCII